MILGFWGDRVVSVDFHVFVLGLPDLLLLVIGPFVFNFTFDRLCLCLVILGVSRNFS